jgi:NADH:ubiquinone oxidoreductase subunit E
MKKQILICTNRRLTAKSPSCAWGGAEAIANELEQLIAKRDLGITVERSACLGRCADGPNLRFAPGGEFIGALTYESLPDVLTRLEVFLHEG